MIKLDITILEEVGLGDLPEEEKKKLFETFVQTLELNVGTTLSQKMTDEQLEAFMKLVDANDQDGAKKWLEDNAPDYKDVVASELDKLKADMQQNSQAIKDSINTT